MLILAQIVSENCFVSCLIGNKSKKNCRQWGPTFCEKDKDCSKSPYATFTLHGLWPNDNSGNGPYDCDGQYSSSLLSNSMKNQLNCEWPSYTGSNEGKHEFYGIWSAIFPTVQGFICLKCMYMSVHVNLSI